MQLTVKCVACKHKEKIPQSKINPTTSTATCSKCSSPALITGVKEK